MKILITGEKGDLGSFFYNELKKKHDVYKISNLKNLNKIDIFIHMGASGPKKEFKKIVNSNVLKLRAMFFKLKKLKIRQSIFFSSTSIYGKYENMNITEKKIFKNQSIYGLSKLYGEIFFLNNFNSTLCLRIPAILTKNNFDHFIGRQAKKLLRNKDIILDNDKKFNFFLDPNNLLEFIMKSKTIKKNQVVNLCSDSQWTIYKIVSYLKKKFNSNSKISIKFNNKKNVTLSNKKAKNELNFKPYSAKKSLDNWIDILKK